MAAAMNKLLKDIRQIEFTRVSYDKKDEDYFEFERGRIPILISAPHGTPHFRRDRWVGEDEYTSSLAIKLGEMTGAHVIYVKNKTHEDPNYQERTKYKDKIREIVKAYGIRFLADIHGADKHRPFGICVGTRYDNLKQCSCPTYKGIIRSILKDFQSSKIFNHPGFKARTRGTVTSFARLVCGIESAQFEINGRYRIIERKPDSTKAIEGVEPEFRAEEEDVLKLFECLREIILRIHARVEEDMHPLEKGLTWHRFRGTRSF